MEKIRVLVANRPRLMRELVMATISDQPDIEVMGDISDDTDIGEMVEQLRPDFVIIALDRADQRPALCDDLFARHPDMKILAMAPERNSSVFFWSVMDIRSARVESSEAGILGALRGKAQPVMQ
jgi:chemotaxis response regulator CheB